MHSKYQLIYFVTLPAIDVFILTCVFIRVLDCMCVLDCCVPQVLCQLSYIFQLSFCYINCATISMVNKDVYINSFCFWKLVPGCPILRCFHRISDRLSTEIGLTLFLLRARVHPQSAGGLNNPSKKLLLLCYLPNFIISITSVIYNFYLLFVKVNGWWLAKKPGTWDHNGSVQKVLSSKTA